MDHGNLTEQLADELTDMSLDSQRVASSIERTIAGAVHSLGDELANELMREFEGVPDRWKMARTRKLFQKVGPLIERRWGSLGRTVFDELGGLGEITVQSIDEIHRRVIRVDIFRTQVGDKWTRNRVRGLLVPRSAQERVPLSKFWSEQTEDIRRKFEGQVRTGVLQNESIDDMIRRVRGKVVGREKVRMPDGKLRSVPKRVGGVLPTTQQHAETLVRTAVNGVNNAALMDTYQANDSLIRGVQVVVTLDARTSEICMARSGGAWDPKTGEPLKESRVKIPYPGPLPWHPRERSVFVAVLKSAEEILGLGEGGESVSQLSDTTQASMDGQVAGNLNFEDFLKRKGEDFAKEKLGPARYDLWKRGQINLSELVNQKGDPLSVKELRALRENRQRRAAG